MNKILTIIDKEWAEIFKNRLILYTMFLMPLLFTALPLVMLGAMGGQSTGDVTDMPPQFLELCGELQGTECYQLFMSNQFLLLFMMLPLVIPATIAAYSIVGEKTTRCLEPLLATPISTVELLLGKGLAALIPGVAAGWGSFALFALGAWILVDNPALLARLLDGMWFIAIGVVGPLVALAGISVAIMVSSRVNDPRTAEQITMVLIIPLLGLFFAQIAGVVMVNAGLLWALAGVLVLVDVGLVWLGARAFQRETILTKWK